MDGHGAPGRGGGTRDLVLEGGLAVSLGAPGIVPDAELVVSRGRIQALGGASGRLRPRSRVLDCRGKVLMPGLVNAHLHSEFLLLKGLVEDRRLREWEESPEFNRAWSWVRDPKNVPFVKAAYRASYLQAILGGTTFVGEFNCADDAIRACVAAMEECGIRGLPTLDLERRSRFPDIEARGCLYAMDDEEELGEAELGQARELVASRPEARLTMHAAETRERLELVLARHGRTTVDLLDAHGLLGPGLLLSHAIHVSERELGRLAATGTCVVASPVAEMKLADGVAPIVEMLDLGVVVALGTDAAVCNNGADMFQELKAAGLVQKLSRGAQALPAEEALRLGTRNGARCFGLDDRLGSLEPGMAADIVCLNGRSSRLVPLIHNGRHSNVMANLVYCATASDVLDVVVGGEVLVEDGRHVRLEEARLLGELQDAAEALHRDMSG